LLLTCLARRGAVLLLLIAPSCGPRSPVHEPVDAGTDGSVGPFDGGPVLVLPGQFTGENEALRMLSDGDPVDLVQPPQGGHVIFIGAKVQNLAPEIDTVDLSVRFRRLGSGSIIQEERRTIVMRPVDGEPGWKQPDLRSRSQFGQPALCPDYDHEDIVGTELTLEVEVTPIYVLSPVTSGGVRRVVATCDRALDEALCLCECTANYVLGRCPVKRGDLDAGAD
jgi:hypothetical protein